MVETDETETEEEKEVEEKVAVAKADAETEVRRQRHTADWAETKGRDRNDTNTGKGISPRQRGIVGVKDSSRGWCRGQEEEGRDPARAKQPPRRCRARVE